MRRETSFLSPAVTILLAMVISTLSTMIILIPTTEAATPTVSISKIYDVTGPGTTFIVNITVSEVANLNLWGVNISWNPEIIRLSEDDPNGTAYPSQGAKKYNVYEGPFLKEAGATIFSITGLNKAEGKARFACALLGTQSRSGSDVLATINFTLVSEGTTDIQIDGPNKGKSILQDPSVKPIDHEDIDGIVSDKPPPPPAIWTQLWFQIAVVVIVIVVLVAYIVIKGRKPIEE